ncbi:hypothetical protein [Tenacibaculum maritimum]|uniref:Uncharacterized protein n=2 Tax=Tenacibaculum maritimum TaxID=107401 RepID=A0A2H1E7Z6_9FLAO|nr:hypothetical protein [Tenacibaculum maritimum]SFZ81033.1 conserved protein of unknown function. Putative prophage protein [Tenacibaculum maritimum NCIMB 2154]
MIKSTFDTTSLSYESYQFREELRNEFYLNRIEPFKPGLWEYEGKWYNTKYKLYIAILAYKTAEQLGIKDVLGLLAVLSGQPFIPTRAKLDGKRSTKNTSVASKYLSKIPGKSPVRLPTVTGVPKIIGGNGMKVTMTKIIGRFIGRATPFIGWGVLAYDLGVIFYNTQVQFNEITDEK